MLRLLAPFLPHGLIAAVLLALVIGIYQAGVNAERKRGEAAQLRVEIETIRLDRTLAEKALISAADQAKQLEAEVQLNEEELDALRKTLAARPQGSGNPAADADLDLLYGRP